MFPNFGRQIRTDPKFGNIYDHFSVVYEFAGGKKVFSYCRQTPDPSWPRTLSDVNDHVIGTKGQAHLMKHTVLPTGGQAWSFDGESKSMYVVEHEELYAGIRAGKLINDAESAA